MIPDIANVESVQRLNFTCKEENNWEQARSTIDNEIS